MTEKEMYEELKGKMQIVSDNLWWAQCSADNILRNLYSCVNINNSAFRDNDSRDLKNDIERRRNDMNDTVLRTIQENIDNAE